MNDFVRNLDRRALTRRLQRVSDGQGGWEQTHADYLVDVPCRRRPVGAGGSEVTIAEQLQAVVAHLVYFEPGDDIARGDQVVVDGYEMVVEAVIEPSVPVYLAAACSETQLGA